MEKNDFPMKKEQKEIIALFSLTCAKEHFGVCVGQKKTKREIA
jgi:hypothetical protein